MTIDVIYEGELRTRVTHGPSGTVIETDAPTDNQGRGERFSPTDLVAAAVGACLMTMAGVGAKRRGIDLRGSTVRVTKEIGEGPRRIVRLPVTMMLPARLSAEERAYLERMALTCPVHKSLHSAIDSPVTFRYQ